MRGVQRFAAWMGVSCSCGGGTTCNEGGGGGGGGVRVNVRFTLLATFQIIFKGKRGRKLTVCVGQKRNPRGLTHKENIHTQVRSLGKWFNCNEI